MKKNLIIITVVVIGLVLAGSLLYFIRKASNDMLEEFRIMNERFEENNAQAQTSIDSLEQTIAYTNFNDELGQLDKLNSDFNNYIEDLKGQLVDKIGDANDPNMLDNVALSNEVFFTKDGYSDTGNEFVNTVETYKKSVAEIFEGLPIHIATELERLFNNHDKVDDWLNYNFKDFPLVATITKLTAMTLDVETLKGIIIEKLLTL